MKGFEKAIKHPLFKYAIYTLAIINLYGYITKNKINCLLSFVGAVMVTHYFIKKNIPLALLVGLFISSFVLGCGKILEGIMFKGTREYNVVNADGCPFEFPFRTQQPGHGPGFKYCYNKFDCAKAVDPVTCTKMEWREMGTEMVLGADHSYITEAAGNTAKPAPAALTEEQTFNVSIKSAAPVSTTSSSSSQTTSCPSTCNTCEEGGSWVGSEGGSYSKPCTQWCSTSGYCGEEDAYKNGGTDCTGC